MRSFAFACCAVVACTHHDPGAPVDAPATHDALVLDAAPDAANVGKTCTGLAYCDDFEEYPPGALADGGQLGPWSVAVSAVTFQVDATMGYKSAHSLRVTVPGNVNSGTGGTPSHGLLSQKAAQGVVAGNDLYGRAMIYYASTGGDGLPLAVHSWFFSTGGTSSQLNMPASINLGGGGAKMQLNYHPGDISVQAAR